MLPLLVRVTVFAILMEAERAFVKRRGADLQIVPFVAILITLLLVNVRCETNASCILIADFYM